MGTFSIDFGRIADSSRRLVGDGVVKMQAAIGRAPSDSQADEIKKVVDAKIVMAEQILTELFDEIPGVPRIAAKMAAHAAGMILSAVVAGGIQAVKDKNG
jgi:hypothetical protein